MKKKKELKNLWQTIVGKTIKVVDEEFGSNVIKIIFTDDSEQVIDTEHIGHGLYRPTLEDTDYYLPQYPSPYDL